MSCQTEIRVALRSPWDVPLTLLIVLGYGTLGLVYLCWVWSADIGDLFGDGSIYMLMARHFSPFYAHSEVLTEAVAGVTYPPLFPLLIGLLGGSMLAGHLLVAAALLASFWCLYQWLRDEGVGRIASACAVAVFALRPGTYFLALKIYTENPYLLFSLIAILAESRADKSRPALRWAAAAAVAAASLTRTAALPLLAAFILRMLLRRPRQWIGLVALSAVPFAAWAIWSLLHRAGIYGYFDQLHGAYHRDPLAALTDQLKIESRRIWVAWLQTWLGGDRSSVVPAYLIVAFGALGLIACARRLLSLRFDAIYVAIYLVLLLLWPYPFEAERLSYVVVPVLMVQALSLLNFVPDRYAARPVTALIVGMLLLAVLPALFLTAHRFMDPLPPQLAGARHTEPYYAADPRIAMQAARIYGASLDVLGRAAGIVGERECIFGTRNNLVTLYSGRNSDVPPGDSATQDAFEQGIGRCRFAFLLAYTSPNFAEALYPLGRLGERANLVDADSSRIGADVSIFAGLVEIAPRRHD